MTQTNDWKIALLGTLQKYILMEMASCGMVRLHLQAGRRFIFAVKTGVLNLVRFRSSD